MNSNNSFTIFPSTSSAFSTSFTPSFAKYYGVRGNKRKNFRDLERIQKAVESENSIVESKPLDPPTDKLFWNDIWIP